MAELTRDDLLEEARIERVLVRYASALDERDWAALDEVFVAEASALYHGIGSYSGREAIVATVRQALAPCGRTQHLLGNVRITLSGAEASAKCYLQAIHAGQGRLPGANATVWGEYRDQLEKRPKAGASRELCSRCPATSAAPRWRQKPRPHERRGRSAGLLLDAGRQLCFWRCRP
ncbi:MAG: nuclear transport factor 2 family protein [Zoogloea sp.]|nr:nuclear transport factor 2 family protein [Zoogloea sp.]